MLCTLGGSAGLHPPSNGAAQLAIVEGRDPRQERLSQQFLPEEFIYVVPPGQVSNGSTRNSVCRPVIQPSFRPVQCMPSFIWVDKEATILRFRRVIARVSKWSTCGAAPGRPEGELPGSGQVHEYGPRPVQ